MTDQSTWYVYVVMCRDSTLYCGCTKDVKRRVGEHNGSTRGAKYTRSRRPVVLLKSWGFPNQSDALKAEIRFKRLPKSSKNIILSATQPDILHDSVDVAKLTACSTTPYT